MSECTKVVNLTTHVRIARVSECVVPVFEQRLGRTVLAGWMVERKLAA